MGVLTLTKPDDRAGLGGVSCVRSGPLTVASGRRRKTQPLHDISHAARRRREARRFMAWNSSHSCRDMAWLRERFRFGTNGFIHGRSDDPARHVVCFLNSRYSEAARHTGHSSPGAPARSPPGRQEEAAYAAARHASTLCWRRRISGGREKRRPPSPACHADHRPRRTCPYPAARPAE